MHGLGGAQEKTNKVEENVISLGLPSPCRLASPRLASLEVSVMETDEARWTTALHISSRLALASCLLLGCAPGRIDWACEAGDVALNFMRERHAGILR
mmetsp:Transcript_24031/g.36349  ORF Transcript_24031/g.36349 Transcript_24031/m.36349 type:complete len:98 (+) Transcript_24031:580-873(+)